MKHGLDRGMNQVLIRKSNVTSKKSDTCPNLVHLYSVVPVRVYQNRETG